MSVEATALMRAIRDCPEDDLPRLAYADYLAENGDPDRGEFIRIQVDLSRLPDDDPQRRKHEDREHELLAENESRWLDCPELHGWCWERGFVVDVAAPPLVMLDHAPDLLADHPIRRWRVTSSQSDLEPDLLEAGRASWARRLEGVSLIGWYQEVGELERFLIRSDLERLRELDLTGRPGLGDLPEILARAPFRDQLRVLRCGSEYGGMCGRLDLWELARILEAARLTELAAPGTLLTAGDVRTILVSPCARELATLDVRANDIEPDAHDGFRNVRSRIRSLDLSGTPLGAISLERVLNSEALGELRSLQLNGCGSAMANVQVLAASPFWRQADELRMRNATVPLNALEPLFTSAGPPNLRTLDVAENYLRDAGVAELCAAAWAGSLTSLDLSRNYLSDDAVRTIVSSGRFTRLRALRLRFNQPEWQDDETDRATITDASARVLAESPSLANLRLLDLSGTQLPPDALLSVLDGPRWRLAGLGLSACNLSGEVLGALAGSPRLTRLTWLDLSHNPRLGGDTLMPLAESEYLCGLTELDVRGLNLDDEVRTALRQRLGRRLSE